MIKPVHRPANIPNTLQKPNQLLSFVTGIKQAIQWVFSCTENIHSGDGIHCEGWITGNPKISLNLIEGEGIKIESAPQNEFDTALKISSTGGGGGGLSALTVGDVQNVTNLQFSSSTESDDLQFNYEYSSPSTNHADVKITADDESMKSYFLKLLDYDSDFASDVASKILDKITFTGGEGANIEIDKDTENNEVTIDVHYL